MYELPDPNAITPGGLPLQSQSVLQGFDIEAVVLDASMQPVAYTHRMYLGEGGQIVLGANSLEHLARLSELQGESASVLIKDIFGTLLQYAFTVKDISLVGEPWRSIVWVTIHIGKGLGQPWTDRSKDQQFLNLFNAPLLPSCQPREFPSRFPASGKQA